MLKGVLEMRNYLKPAMEMEAFEVEDIITASAPAIIVSPDPTEVETDEFMAAPVIDAVDFN